jgi:uncharacterized protein YggE
VLTRALLLSTAALISAAPLRAQESVGAVPRDPVPVISTSASGDAKYTPDRARIDIAVQTRATTAAAAASDNAKRQNAVISALRSAGLSNEQISTIGYNVNPEYKYAPNSTPTLVGYTVTNTVVAEVRDVSQLGKILDSALGAGANTVSSLQFYASNTDAARQQAIGAAVQKARADAEVAARAAGGTLGPLMSMDVFGGAQAPPPPRPMYRAMASAEVAAAPTPVTPGEQTITAGVSMRWRFVPGR